MIALLKKESDISQDFIHVHCNSEMEAATLKRTELSTDLKNCTVVELLLATHSAVILI